MAASGILPSMASPEDLDNENLRSTQRFLSRLSRRKKASSGAEALLLASKEPDILDELDHAFDEIPNDDVSPEQAQLERLASTLREVKAHFNSAVRNVESQEAASVLIDHLLGLILDAQHVVRLDEIKTLAEVWGPSLEDTSSPGARVVARIDCPARFRTLLGVDEPAEQRNEVSQHDIIVSDWALGCIVVAIVGDTLAVHHNREPPSTTITFLVNNRREAPDLSKVLPKDLRPLRYLADPRNALRVSAVLVNVLRNRWPLLAGHFEQRFREWSHLLADHTRHWRPCLASYRDRVFASQDEWRYFLEWAGARIDTNGLQPPDALQRVQHEQALRPESYFKYIDSLVEVLRNDTTRS